MLRGLLSRSDVLISGFSMLPGKELALNKCKLLFLSVRPYDIFFTWRKKKDENYGSQPT